MKARRASVAIKGNVTVNGNVTVGSGCGSASRRDLDEIRELTQRIRNNPQDNEATKKLIARYRNMIRRVVEDHFPQDSQRDYLNRVGEETAWRVARDHELEPLGFSCYLRRALKHRIERAICHEFLLYLPEEVRNTLCWKLEQFIWNELGAGFGDAYRAQLDWADKDRRSRATQELKIDEEKLDELLSALVLTGVDPLLTDDDNEEGEDGIASDKSFDLEDESADVYAQVEKSEMARDLRKALSKHCTERERAVLSLKYGLDDGKGKTYSEIGKLMGFSESNAKWIAGKALKKMEKKAPELREYLS
ncbi:MAG: sigma-70 family RNA polymerase sigma factor [Lachnospiraceae bacterium]|nr:sigma-70 family RNA polymerase sigma factor [Lachnospiraceae bacterium]